MPLSRRDFLKASGVTGLASLEFLPLLSDINVVQASNPDFEPDIELLLQAGQDSVPILEDAPTTVWRYTGEVITGNTDTLQFISNSYLGPIIRARTGHKVRIRFRNNLPEESNVHWHGLYVPDYADGHPRFVAQSGEEYVYEFEVINRAGTYWYHPHPHQRTGAQVNAGMAGLFIVEDETEDALDLPSGEFDLPLVLQDRRFDADNQLLYVNNMHDQTMGFRGNRILVNGKLDKTIRVATRPYRLRLLNGSNSRIYILAWDDESPMKVIGTDGGLIERTVIKRYITFGPAERAELWVDFSDYEAGTKVSLVDLGEGQPIIIATFSVDEVSDVRMTLPNTLREIDSIDPQQASNIDNPRLFEFSMGRTPVINNQTYQIDAVADNEIVRLGDTEIWQFTNNSQAGGMMSLPHPVHIHGRQFQIIERTIDPDFVQQWAGIINGYLDYGWKDTFLLLPGETVRIVINFDNYEGIFVYHCHTLEHEDLGMMRNYQVKA